MISMGSVWDRTVDVLRGRAAILAGIAFATLFLPGLLAGAVGMLLGVGPGTALARGLLNVATIALFVYGMLALTAVASDPAVDQAAAYRIAARRLGAALGLLLVLLVALPLLVMPAAVALAAAGATVTATGMVDVQRAAPGPLAVAALVALVAAAVGLWLSARLVPLFAVVVNERHGWRALRRSFALSRGHALRLIGVLILGGVLLLVATMAVYSVVGVALRLALGSEARAAVAFGVAAAGGLISAAGSVVQAVFYTSFYAAAVAREEETARPA